MHDKKQNTFPIEKAINLREICTAYIVNDFKRQKYISERATTFQIGYQRCRYPLKLEVSYSTFRQKEDVTPRSKAKNHA